MHMMWPRDKSSVEGAKFDRESAARIWRFASSYRTLVIGFLLTVILDAVLGLVPPLLFGRIIDVAIPNDDRGLLAVFAAMIVGASLLSGIVGLFERYWSSRIGEGVIYDLRVALFDHVQKLPLAFFTRTQTGALTSRLNNDVIGAQRALTATLGTVVSNVITLVTTLIAMFVIEWRLTILALILTPFFVLPLPTNRADPAVDHPRVDGPQRQDEHHDDRAVQRVWRAVGEAVRPGQRRAGGLRRPCLPGPRHRCALRGVHPRVHDDARLARGHGHRARLRPRRPVRLQRLARDRPARLDGAPRRSDLHAADGSHQRQDRRAHRARLVRSCLRSTRCAEPAHRQGRRRAGHRPEGPHRVPRRQLPLPPLRRDDRARLGDSRDRPSPKPRSLLC